MDDRLASPEEILHDQILRAPGIHLREIARRTHLTLGTTFSHLSDMEARSILERREDARYHRYFVKGQLSADEQKMLIACRGARARRAILHLLNVPQATQKELAVASGVSRSAIAAVVRTLHERGVLAVLPAGRERVYELTDRAQAVRMLTRFADSFPAEVEAARPPSGVAPAAALGQTD